MFDSLKYKVNRIENTYAWIIDIEISKINKILLINIDKGKMINQFIIKFLNKINIKCPEIKFGDKRIDKVNGGINNIINSIITIKCISKFEEFIGTKWVKNFIG